MPIDFPQNLAEKDTNIADKTELPEGEYIRVKSEHPDWWRAGKDGMVVEDMGEDGVALFFGVDRHNNFQHLVCVGPELWQRSELDLNSLSTS